MEGRRNDVGRWALAGLLCALLSGLAVEAVGQPTPREPIRLAYRSEGLCPSGEQFFSDVRARTEKIRPATSSEVARTLKIEVEEGPSESRGSLSIAGTDGTTSSTRTVRAKTCRDVVTALALVAALAIDPEARTSPLSPLMVSDAGQPPVPPSNDAGAPAPAILTSPEDGGAPASREPIALPPRSSGATDAGPSVETPREASRPSQTRFSVGVGAEGSSVLGVRPALSVTLGLDWVRDSMVSPAFLLRLTRSFQGTSVQTGGSANVTFSAAAIEPCPFAFRLGEAFALLPCARLAFGFLEAEGSGVTTPSSALRGWGDVGAHLRASFRLGGPVFLDAHGGARFPLFRDRFFVDQSTTLYEAPAALGAFGGDLRFAFP